jgi:hypothetical protein
MGARLACCTSVAGFNLGNVADLMAGSTDYEGRLAQEAEFARDAITAI